MISTSVALTQSADLCTWRLLSSRSLTRSIIRGRARDIARLNLDEVGAPLQFYAESGRFQDELRRMLWCSRKSALYTRSRRIILLGPLCTHREHGDYCAAAASACVLLYNLCPLLSYHLLCKLCSSFHRARCWWQWQWQQKCSQHEKSFI